MRLINNKIDVSKGEPKLHQYEEWLPTIPMYKTFTDTGYRYRKNLYSQSGTYMETFEYTRTFNHDVFVQKDTAPGALIGEFYFRWDDEQVIHQDSMQFPSEICTWSSGIMGSGINIDISSSASSLFVTMMTFAVMSASMM